MNVGNVIPCISSNSKSKWSFFYRRVQNKSFDLCSSLKKVGHPFFALAIRRKAENLVANVYQSSSNIYYRTWVVSSIRGGKIENFLTFILLVNLSSCKNRMHFWCFWQDQPINMPLKWACGPNFFDLTFYYVDFGNWTIFYAYFVVASVNVTWQG